jgi:DNA-binding GntR family transcriptional regulator
MPLTKPDHYFDPDAAPGNSTRSEWVYERLLRDIKAGQFSRGDRLREADIAEALGVSRTPVREALLRLQHRGLVELTVGGLTVSRLSRLQLIELFSMREVLEGSAAMFAAQHAAPAEIAGLRELLALFEQFLADPARLAKINTEFHKAIYGAAHNRYLTRTLEELNDSLALLPSTTFTVPNRGTKSLAEHCRIVDAIEAREPERARLEAGEHIRHAQAARLSMMLESAQTS